MATLLAMEAALAAARTGWRAHFFTLDYSKSDMVDRLRQLGHDPDRALDDLQLDTSDCICADYIIQQVGQHVDRTLVVVDYLQLLDQDRRHPDLQSQIV
ncbi:MAG: DNA helicase, partial [Pseudomonadota bacterium]